jgi:hypothetical protein
MHIGTVRQHVHALRNLSVFAVEIVDVRTLNRLRLSVSRFDMIVFHYSIVIAQGYHIEPTLRRRLASSKALKVLFIQDEYRWIDATAEAIGDLGISVIFTVLNKDAVDKVYHHPWLKDVRKEITLTGFVDERLLGRRVPPYEERRIDVAYRARKVPFWLGSFAMEKWTIGEKFRAAADRFGLSHDISSEENARLYGDRWICFLANAKAVLGTESGASVCDFTGEIRSRVDAAVVSDPEISFEAVHQAILKDSDGQVIIHVISPRVFEAAALRSLMINYPGEYSGRLVPWRHYVPLEKDHSNIEQVMNIIRDPRRAQEIVDAAYREVACNSENSFRAMVHHFDRVAIEELGLPVGGNGGQKKDLFWMRPPTVLEVMSWTGVHVRRLGRKVRRPVGIVARRLLPARTRKWIRSKISW